MIKPFFLGVALAGFIAAPSFGAEVEAKADVDIDRDKVEVRTEADRDRSAESRRARADRVYADQERVRNENRASKLIGMEVWNREDVKLGVVKDVVLDLNAGKVSYVVMGAGGFLGFREKLVALPTGQFTRHGHENVLVIDAKATQIERMPGFAATNWPTPDDDRYGPKAFAQYRTEAKANAAADFDVNVTDDDIKIRSDLETTRRDQSERAVGSSARGEVRTSNNVENADRTRVFQGEIVTIKPESMTMVVRDRAGNRRTFLFGHNPRIMVNRNASGSMTDLKQGYQVRVEHHRDSEGDYIVDRVTQVRGR